MSCSVCIQSINKKILYNDCILECLEKIRIHYMNFKIQLEERDATIENLRGNNKDLMRTIDNLTDELQIFKANSDKKRRKTNSFDSESEANASLNGIENASRNALFSDKSLDDLNKALTINSDLDESVFGPSQTVIAAKSSIDVASDGKQEITQTNQPAQETEKDVITQSDVILPRRIKENKRTNNDKNLMKPPEWRCKSSTRMKNRNNVSNNNWNLSFIQPTQKKEDFLKSPELKVVPFGDSPNKMSSPELGLSKSKSSLSLRRPVRHNLLRQTKISFKTEKENKDVDPDETYCDEVTPSPTCITLTATENKKTRTRSLRKFDSKKFENITFDSSPKKSCEAADPEGKMRIKLEPASVKKETIRNIIKSISPKKTPSKISPKKCDLLADMSGVYEMDADASSSVVILPSQHDDVVFIEETDPGFDNIDSMDLLDEMMKVNETSDILKEIERERIKQLKNKQEVKNLKLLEKSKRQLVDLTAEIAIEAEAEDNQPKTESDDELPVFDCDECKAYAKFLGRDLTKQEVAKRLRECTKHKKPIDLHQTPEGFWNPLFPTTQEINEMNQTLIDTRFTKKGK